MEVHAEDEPGVTRYVACCVLCIGPLMISRTLPRPIVTSQHRHEEAALVCSLGLVSLQEEEVL